MLSAQEQLKILMRGVTEVVPQDELLQKLEKSVATGVPLRIKMGVDPTAPDVHFGHTVVMRKMRQFQQLGHQVVLIVGDYTATIGDPSGRASARTRLSHEVVLENAKTYQEQFFKIVDRTKTEVVYNGDWFSKMTFAEVTQLMGQITVAQMLERQDFQNRYAKGEPISLHEFMYPMMQGWDSVVIRSDVELGGTDQKFNVLRGRELQKSQGQDTQIGLFMPILLGTCGKEKMSKSLGNYVGLNESAQSMYHKIYTIADNQIVSWFELLTDIISEELQKISDGIVANSVNPNELKHRLAHEIVSFYYSAEDAEQAKAAEAAIHSGNAIPADAPLVELANGEYGLIKLLSEIKAFASNGEARKMILNGGVKVNSEKVIDPTFVVNVDSEVVIQVGKRQFWKVRSV
jgi:tyrosyl-tRNA synthetase